MAKPYRKDDKLEYEFLPGALEVIQTPPSKASRILLWITCAFLIGVVIWSYIGTVDEVAIARGKVVPSGGQKVVQSFNEGTITDILVKEGQLVKEGEILFLLDPSVDQVYFESLEKEQSAKKTELELYQAYLNGTKSEIDRSLPQSKLVETINGQYEEAETTAISKIKQLEAKLLTEKTLLEKLNLENKYLLEQEKKKEEDFLQGGSNRERKVEIETKLNQAKIDLEEKNVQIAAVLAKASETNVTVAGASNEKTEAENQAVVSGDQEVNSYGITPPLPTSSDSNSEMADSADSHMPNNIEKSPLEILENEKKTLEGQLKSFEEELKNQAKRVEQEEEALKNSWNLALQERLLKDKDILVQTQQIKQISIELDLAVQELDNIYLEKNKVFLSEIVGGEAALAKINTEIAAIDEKNKHNVITAPVTGHIHGLSQTTVGGIVTPAQVLATVVSNEDSLLIEAYLPNKDVGFVKVGQEASVKFDTFSFQRYGLVEGEVVYVSPDAFNIEELGTVYLIQVKLEKESIKISDQDLKFTPGMTVSVEVKTGHKRIIEFFLEPLIKYVNEGLSVR